MHRLSSCSIMGRILFVMLLTASVRFTAYGQKSPHGPLKIPCSDCHTTESWKGLAQPMKFSHSTTSFPLQGAHINVPCQQCHTANRFAGTASDCFTCHRKDFASTANPNHELGKLSHDCLTCHTNTSWKPSTFQHSKTNFQLLGAHLSVDCASCHTNNRFAGLSTDCFGCHQRDFAQATSPNHTQGMFSHDCLTCHTMNAWQPSTFDHNKTNFALTGAHSNAECSSCHANGRFRGTPTDCYSCHQQNFAKTVDPNHTQSQFSHDCLTCHTVTAWKPATFDHNKTNFQLVGAHISVQCNSCHTNSRFAGTPTDCYSCHTQEFAKTTDPNHAQSQFSHNCMTCHTMTAWKPATFDHNKTSFQLVGAHVSVQCNSCHTNGRFAGTPTDCYSCHTQDFAKTTDPNHVQSQFSHDCVTCHSMTAWKPSTFNHSTTGFSLTGAHAAVACVTCHTNGRFAGTPSDCYSCHQADFTGTTDPNHVAGNFDHNCITCHSTTAWEPATFDHNKTNFKLTGAHTQAQCAQCHAGGKFSATPTDCYSCHQNDYNSTTDPNHASAGFPTTCQTCHTTTSWAGATFNHTWFPIKHGNSGGQCSTCHTNKNDYKVFQCIDCHEHNRTDMDRKHQGRSGYTWASSACYRCHPNGRE